ncbi:hypothetical protein RV06_GL002578 [Enterococcus haemoperoxidus]|nr:hypothetical protein RV06_GL002578 [Enterococcus haemoperoxidus]
MLAFISATYLAGIKSTTLIIAIIGVDQEALIVKFTRQFHLLFQHLF